MFTYDESLISDVYKDAYGFRSASEMWPSSGSGAEKQAEWDRVCDMVSESIKDEEREAEASKKRFEARIENCLSVGAKDRKTAIRWAIGTHCKDFSCVQEVGHALWKFGLLKYEREYLKEIGI